MGDVASPQYPQPQPAQNNSLMSDPAMAIGIINGLNQNKLFQAQYPALAEIPSANLQSIRQLQQMQARQNISTAYSNAVRGLGPNATEDDVRNIGVNLARSNPDIATTYPDMIPAAKDVILNTRKGNIQAGANTLFNSTLSPGEGSSRTDVTNPDNSRFSISTPSANMAGALPTATSAGTPEVIAANKKNYTEDQEKSAVTQSNLRQLETVYPLVQKLSNANFGPYSTDYAKLRGTAITAGIISPEDSDLDMRQKVGKYFLKYAQGAVNAGRSDQALATAIGSNPNLDLTKAANLALVRNQIGMDKADASIPVLYDKLHPGNDSKGAYNAFKANFYRNYDPRAFTYDKMSPEERRGLIDSLGDKRSPAYQKFAKTYDQLKNTNFLTPNAQ